MALQPRRRLHACGRESRVPRVAGLKSERLLLQFRSSCTFVDWPQIHLDRRFSGWTKFWTEILHCLSSAEVRLNGKALAIALTAFQNRSEERRGHPWRAGGAPWQPWPALLQRRGRSGYILGGALKYGQSFRLMK